GRMARDEDRRGFCFHAEALPHNRPRRGRLRPHRPRHGCRRRNPGLQYARLRNQRGRRPRHRFDACSATRHCQLSSESASRSGGRRRLRACPARPALTWTDLRRRRPRTHWRRYRSPRQGLRYERRRLRPLCVARLRDRRRRRSGLEDLLAVSDVVSLHCPLTDETRKMINAATIAQMKRDAILINTARGAIVDIRALVDPLRNGAIAGAGLDVLPIEPPPRDDEFAIAYRNRADPIVGERLIVTPHAAWSSPESVSDARRLAVETAMLYLREGKLRNLVNAPLGTVVLS